MKNNKFEYGYKNPVFEAIESVGGFAIIIVVLFIIYQGVVFWHQTIQKNHCQEIATYYGVNTSHSMLPKGVDIRYISGSCVRTDNLTVMTGNEH